MPPSDQAVVAVDTGGTFTDLIYVEAGRQVRLKVPSTPEDPAEAVLAGLRQLVPPGRPFLLVHGSTVATNTLLERTGARVRLITNRGFEDILEIGRQNRPQLYALVGWRPPPLVDREDRLGVAGRLDEAGREIEPLDREELAELPARVADAEAVAVVLLHAYANPIHEAQVADALDLGSGGAPVSISHRILPEFREFERTSTTVVNAYVQPRMDRYLERIEREAGAARFRVMGSDGGALSARRARAEPVRTVLSGPAGGVVGGLDWGRRTGHPHVITFDMGGTSTDVSLCPGRPLHTREMEIGGQPIAVPVLDIYTVGAGGGSLAWLDPAGALRVGPASAGAEPGPICYGRGGTGVTVTDANVWLGRLPDDAFLGGGIGLDREAIRAPLESLAERLGSSPERTAAGILEIAETAMTGALRVISVERGFDPKGFALVAFGGAGGLHAVRLATQLGVTRVLVPPDPGLLSAFGMLAAPVRREETRTLFRTSTDPDTEDILTRTRHALDQQARTALRPDVGDERIDTRHWVDARYRGQSYELRVPADGWQDAFHAAHEARYGYARRESDVELIAARVVATVAGTPPAADPDLTDTTGDEPRPARVWWAGDWIDAQRVARSSLAPGSTLAGPVVVPEYSGTTWVPPGAVLHVDASGCLDILVHE